MKKIRYWYRLLISFIIRFRIILFIGILIGFFVFIVISFLIPTFFSDSTERIGVVGRYSIDNLPNNILSLASQGLTSIDDTGEAVPAIAQSWYSEEEGKRWIFMMKDDLKWHDGSPITSADVNYNFKDVTVQKPDPQTIIFILEDPYAPFPVVVSKPVFKKGLLGTGEWKVDKITQKGSYVETIILENDNGVKKIINFYPTEDNAKIAYKLGQVDILLDLLDPAPFAQWESTTSVVENINNHRYVAIFFNNENELMINKSLRQALAYSIDKDAISSNRAYSPISPNSWVYNPQIKKYDFNQERAKELLEELPADIRENIDIRLATIPVLLPVAEQIAAYWGEIGIKTTVQVASIVPQDYQAFLAIFDIPDDPDQYPLWHSTQTESNIANYSNLRIDKLLEDGRFELKKEARKKIYLDFQRFLLEDVPAVFLYHPVFYTIIRK